MTTCPRCGTKGRPVSSRTVAAQAGSARAASATGGYRFCRTRDCDVVYFVDSRVVAEVGDLATPVFQKSSAPERLVCYCFGHTVHDVEAEVEALGTSRIAEEVAEMCRQGLDRCAETNPQGTCCLGNLRAVAGAAPPACSSGSPCCAPDQEGDA